MSKKQSRSRAMEWKRMSPEARHAELSRRAKLFWSKRTAKEKKERSLLMHKAKLHDYIYKEKIISNPENHKLWTSRKRKSLGLPL